MIDQELEKYYNDYRGMFATDGWKTLMQDLMNNASVINSIESAKDNEDLYFRKGQLAVIANMLNLETQLNAAEEQVEQEEAEQPEED
jgi:hypothetical protein